ncbi:hypothetical protein [Pseudopedobacter sp.]|uniref:hypothetical protein n=1 Tax=Pseudopedobacter sp. TaxID=1936787 RepID=UPI0033401A44
MKKLFLVLAIAGLSTGIMTSCNNSGNKNDSSTEIENTDVVPSGTYQGVAEKVDPDEKEIYVKTADNKTLELYFTDSTKLTRNGQAVEFSELKTGQNLEVTVEKAGERLDPKAVDIKE